MALMKKEAQPCMMRRGNLAMKKRKMLRISRTMM
jgi:hypothetical protein